MLTLPSKLISCLHHHPPTPSQWPTFNIVIGYPDSEHVVFPQGNCSTVLAKRRRMWETWNTALSLHGQDFGYPSMSTLSHFLAHTTLTWTKRTLGDRILHHVLNKEMRPSSKSCPLHPRPQRWCSLSFSGCATQGQCTAGDEESASHHRHGGTGKP